MTIKIIVFITTIIFWLLIGVIGVIRAKENKINWSIIIFLTFVLLIPIIAKLCGLK